MIEYATCAELYNYPDKPAPQGAIVVPEVATGLPKVSNDGKTQTIQLERTYRFHTGARITAANFVAAFNRDANPKLQSPLVSAGYLHEIAGADAVIAGKAQTISGVRALGPYTLQIRTTRLLPDLVSRLAMPFFCPIAVNTPLTEIENPLGSGPYYIASRVPNRQVVLERNRFYRGSRPANVDHVVLTVGLGQEACRQAVAQDELDWCEFLSDQAYREIAAKYGINTHDGQFFFNPTLATGYFAFNHDRPAFKGPGQIPLEKAINWAIDRPALVRATGYLGGKRTDQILPPAMGRDQSIYPLSGVDEESLARARALLAKARFKPTKHEAPRDRRGDQVLRHRRSHVQCGRHPGGILRRRDRTLVRRLRRREHVLRTAPKRRQPQAGGKLEPRLLRPADVQPGDRSHQSPDRSGSPQGLGRS